MEEKVSLDRAMDLIDEHVEPLPAESVEAMMGAGRVLAERVNAWLDLPGADISAYDGYALRSSEIASASAENKVRIEVVGDSTFNLDFEDELPIGGCVKIVTGAIVPEEADAVIPREWVEAAGEDHIDALRAVESGHGIRKKAEEFRVGENVLNRGVVLTPGRISLLVAAGWSEVKVVRLPRVRVIAAGDELKFPGQMLNPGQVYPSAAGGIVSWLKRVGIGDMRLMITADDSFDILEAMPESRVVDMVITLGGTGESDQDVMYEALMEREVDVIFKGIRCKPGHYTTFAMQEDMPIICLPGGPGASEIMFNFLVKRTMSALMGIDKRDLPVNTAVLTDEARGRDDLERLVRVKVHDTGDGLEAEPLSGLGIHREIASSNGVVRLAPGQTIARGDKAEVWITR